MSVCYDRKKMKWVARYCIANEKIWLGRYLTKAEAVASEVATKHHFDISKNKVLTYLEYRFDLPEDMLKNYILEFAYRYTEAADGTMFLPFCKNGILNAIDTNRIPVFVGMTWDEFESKLTDVSRKIFCDAVSIAKVCGEHRLYYADVIKELKQVFLDVDK